MSNSPRRHLKDLFYREYPPRPEAFDRVVNAMQTDHKPRRSRTPIWIAAGVGVAALVVIGFFLCMTFVRKNESHPIIAITPGKDTPTRIVHEPNKSNPVIKHGDAHIAVNPGINTKLIGSQSPKQRPIRPLKDFFAVTAAQNKVTRTDGRAIKLGDRLPTGITVATGKEARLALITRQGSELILAGDSRLAIAADGQRANLLRGRLYCRNRSHEFASITTRAGKVELLGTIVDAAEMGCRAVAITVVQGQVRLANAHGATLVEAGCKTLFNAAAAPTTGRAIDTAAETAWHDTGLLSSAGDIAYAIQRAEVVTFADAYGDTCSTGSTPVPTTELWVMRADGTGKHLVRTYVKGNNSHATLGAWVPGQRAIIIPSVGSLYWGQPDFTIRRANPRNGGPILEEHGDNRILDVTTGGEVSIPLPQEYKATNLTFSPDGKLLAFRGDYDTLVPNHPKVLAPKRQSVCIYNPATGNLKVLFTPYKYASYSWSPDSRHLVASYDLEIPDNNPEMQLAIIDAATGAVTSLSPAGVAPSFSPDGKKIAYWRLGEGAPADQGAPCILDRASGTVIQLAPVATGWSAPRWSPDGKWILYNNADQPIQTGCEYVSSPNTFFVVASDGAMPPRQVYQTRGDFRAMGWSLTGDSIYIVMRYTPHQDRLDDQETISMISPKGKGLIRTLGGNEDDSKLPPEQLREMQGATGLLNEAIFQYSAGWLREFEGKPAAAKTAYRAAADDFAGLLWRYPLSRLASADLTRHADKAAEQAGKTDAQLYEEGCKNRLTYLRELVGNFLLDNRRMPNDLGEVFAWAPTNRTSRFSWFDSNSRIIKTLSTCTAGEVLQYVSVPPEATPKVGDLLIGCPDHPQNNLYWDRELLADWNSRFRFPRK
jgi:hypothetical protein